VIAVFAALGCSLTYGVSNYLAGLQSRRSALVAVVFFRRGTWKTRVV